MVKALSCIVEGGENDSKNQCPCLHIWVNSQLTDFDLYSYLLLKFSCSRRALEVFFPLSSRLFKTIVYLSSIQLVCLFLFFQLSTVNQELSLLRQDKGYLQRQLNDITSKYDHTDTRLKDTVTDLENVKRSREELYEKYVESRCGHVQKKTSKVLSPTQNIAVVYTIQYMAPVSLNLDCVPIITLTVYRHVRNQFENRNSKTEHCMVCMHLCTRVLLECRGRAV